MTVLIRQAKIICSPSPFHGQVKDILIEDGIIRSIADNVPGITGELITVDGLCVSIGWMDVFAHFCDPGFEYRETLETGSNAAAAGGFTDVMLVPNSNPAVHTKSQVEYLVNRSASLKTTIHAIGAVTKNTAGNDLAEMYDMHESGAIAFGDGTHPIQDGGLMLKALQYVKAINGTIIQLPDDQSIGATGLMNEGIISTQLGLPGKPAMAEDLMVQRDIQLAQYTDSKLHLTGVSSAKSLNHIRHAKASGLKVTCSVTPYHLFFNDEDLRQYDTNLKVNPPIRTKEDRGAIQEALIDGTVDCIASHHIPQSYDDKICEFEYAKNGMIGLESLFGTVWQILQEKWQIDDLINLLTVAPRNIFGLAIPVIKEGMPASLTLFNPAVSYTFQEKDIRSRSKNSAFKGKQLTGKVIGIINGNKLHLN